MSAKGKPWTPKQRAANRRHFAALKASGKSGWSAERKARFQATVAKKRRGKRAATAAGNGVDSHAATPRKDGDNGGQHFPLALIPDRMPLHAKTPAHARGAKSNGNGAYAPSARGARLAVAMQLLRTIETLLRLDD